MTNKFFVFFLGVSLMSCTSLENAMGGALANAGDAIRVGEPKIWKSNSPDHNDKKQDEREESGKETY
jgi:hypothetical protein